MNKDWNLEGDEKAKSRIKGILENAGVGGTIEESHEEDGTTVIDRFNLQEVFLYPAQHEEKPSAAFVFLTANGILSGVELHNYDNSGEVVEKKRLHESIASKVIIDLWQLSQKYSRGSDDDNG